MANDAPNTVRLVARAELKLGGADISPGENFMAPEEEGWQFTIAGRAALAKSQTSPPIDFLSRLVERLDALELVGPRFDDPGQLEVFAENCLKGGQLMPSTGGRALHWIERTRFWLPFDASFDWEGVSYRQMVDWMSECLKFTAGRAANHATQAPLSCDEMRKRNLVRHYLEPVRRLNWIEHGHVSSPTYFYAEVSPAWAEYGYLLEDVNTKRQAAYSDCLRQGRVLVVQRENATLRVLPPWDWPKDRHAVPPKGDTWCLFSRDLPVDEKWSGSSRRARIGRAKKFFGEAMRLFGERGKRISEIEAIGLLQDTFGLSKDDAANVRLSVLPPNARKRGRRKVEEVLSNSEISELRIMARGF